MGRGLSGPMDSWAGRDRLKVDSWAGQEERRGLEGSAFFADGRIKGKRPRVEDD